MKAIYGVAYGIQHPERGPLKPAEFTGGEYGAARQLEKIGFEIHKDLDSSDGRDGAWMFQANPAFFDIRGAVTELPEMNWTTAQYAGEISSGDLVYIWEIWSRRWCACPRGDSF